MNLSVVVSALEGQPGLKQVLFGSGLQGDDTTVEQYPAVFVAPFKEIAPDESIEISNHLQITDVMFEVMLVCGYQQFNQAREAVLSALLGQTLMPPEVVVTSTCRLIEGTQVEATGTLVYWRDIFAIRRQRRVLSNV